MYSITIPESLIKKLKIFNNKGRESIIYYSDNDIELYKIYNNTSFKKPTLKKLFDMYARQPNIHRTFLPHGIIYSYENGEKVLMGIVIKKHFGYVPLNESKQFNLDIRKLFIGLIESVRELTDNNIYQTDLNNGNILVSNTGDVQIIDLDGEQCIVSDKTELELLTIIFKQLSTHILYELVLCSPEIKLLFSKKSYNGLLEYGIKPRVIEILSQPEKRNYDALIEIVNLLVSETERKR